VNVVVPRVVAVVQNPEGNPGVERVIVVVRPQPERRPGEERAGVEGEADLELAVGRNGAQSRDEAGDEEGSDELFHGDLLHGFTLLS
jgi:hypothetical protein